MSYRIFIDVDGTVLDTHTPWVDTYNILTGSYLQVSDITDWRISNSMPRMSENVILGLLKMPLFFNRVKPYPGAVSFVDILKSFAQVIFVSDCTWTNETDKRLCLEKHGFIDSRTYMLACTPEERLQLIGSNIILDDNPHTLAKAKNPVAIDRPWNQGFCGPRMLDWFNTDAFFDAFFQRTK